MFNSMTEYQKGASIVDVIVNGNDATFALAMSFIRTIPIVSDPNEAWLDKIPCEKRVPKELAMKAIEWDQLTTNRKYHEKEDFLTTAISAFIDAAARFLEHSPSPDELSKMLRDHDNRLKIMNERNAFIQTFDEEMRERRYLISKTRQLKEETSLSRLIRDTKATPEGHAKDELRKREEKELTDAMEVIRNWEISNEKKFHRE